VAALAAASALAGTTAVPTKVQPPEAASAGDDLMKMPCGAREIPEGEACIPVPAASASRDDDDETSMPDEAPARLPRRPDRPAKVYDLLLPIAGEPPLLGVPGATLDGDDRSILRLGAPQGTPAHAITLEGQQAPFEILGVERLPGRGLVVGALATIGATKKSDGEGFLVLFGSLDGAGPGLERGGRLTDGSVVGFAGDSAARGEPCLRFEVRRLRPGTDAHVTPLAKLVTNAETVATDARNVLPARAGKAVGKAAAQAP